MTKLNTWLASVLALTLTVFLNFSTQAMQRGASDSAGDVVMVDMSGTAPFGGAIRPVPQRDLEAGVRSVDATTGGGANRMLATGGVADTPEAALDRVEVTLQQFGGYQPSPGFKSCCDTCLGNFEVCTQCCFRCCAPSVTFVGASGSFLTAALIWIFESVPSLSPYAAKVGGGVAILTGFLTLLARYMEGRLRTDLRAH